MGADTDMANPLGLPARKFRSRPARALVFLIGALLAVVLGLAVARSVGAAANGLQTGWQAVFLGGGHRRWDVVCGIGSLARNGPTPIPLML